MQKNINAQNSEIAVEYYIYNRVYKNIAGFYSYSKAKKNLDENGLLSSRGIFDFFDIIMPDFGYKMDMKIEKVDWHYPVKGYTLFKIEMPGLRYKYHTGKFEDKDYAFSLDKNGPADLPGEFYLIAINGRREIKYISGLFFTEDIAEDFDLNPVKPESYFDYLKYITYSTQTEDLKFIKKKAKLLLFEAFSQLYSKKVWISINVNKPAEISLSVVGNK
ncbi:hypothetical protein ACVWYN_001670 [Pedobacter sp. UYP24]